ncbi:MAG: undecaprenyldiphospho-muramoylpentapeptide beta-N-acetylglucosaminyltransferase [Azospirillaceae bacterium]|nr:undecaprenyldiphospho-muramoylpentapeptide beta-N-acetylglucosaminyltransferase [Azospirillaceae bacterium]
MPTSSPTTNRATPAAPILLAAGGTGGHLFPAEALARELVARGHAPVLITDRRGKAFGDALPEVTVERIHAGQLRGGFTGKLRGAALLALGALDARILIGRLHPAVVVGFGGYPSVPTLWAAVRAGIPILLHEQNAVLGRANRLFARRAERIAIGFPRTDRVEACDLVKLVHTGNPVRPGFIPLRDQAYLPPEPGGPLRLLVLGGSQGARVFSTLVPAALALLPEDRRARLQLVQQCRPEDIETARKAFADAGIRAELSTFFRDVPDRLRVAHLVITRSGASTVTELTATGRPSILIPYPAAMDDHQTANARAIVEAGGAWLAVQNQLTPQSLAQQLVTLLDDPAALSRAALDARAWGAIDAAARLANVVLDLATDSGAKPMPPDQPRTPPSPSSSLEAAA